MDIKLIIFDFDGTLGDTRQNIIQTLQQTMHEMNLPVANESDCAATIGLVLKDSFKTLFPQLTDELAETCVTTYRRIFEINKKKTQPALFPNVKETLAQIQHLGITITIASSRSSVSLRGFLRDMEIEEYISYIIGAEDVSQPKPNPEPVLSTLSAMNFSAKETLVVGDMPVDIMMGAKAGARTCAVTYGNASYEQLKETGADYIINDMAELMTVIY